MVKPTCRWILQLNTPTSTAIYCEKPVSYTMVEDGGEPGAAKVRKYNYFCDEHQAIVNKEDDE